MPGQPAVPRSAPATAPAAACGHRNLDRRSPTRTGSVEDSSEYLQRVKFQSKSRDNTTASLRGEKLVSDVLNRGLRLGQAQSKTLRSTCRESSFSQRVGIIPQRH